MEQGTRVGLGPIDRLVLLAAWLVSCAAVYGLGFYTGNHTQDRLAGEEERVVRLPVTMAPPPVGQRSRSSDDLSFWNALARWLTSDLRFPASASVIPNGG